MVVLETSKGFPVIDFIDHHGNACSMEISSIADPYCLWIGLVGHPKMHISADQLKELMPHFEKFIENREL
jgi:hypothetical protein